jgi:hypothetical protein
LILEQRIMVVELPDEVAVFLDQLGEQTIFWDRRSWTIRLKGNECT